MAEITPTKDRQVKLRIYKDYEALRHYQAHNIGSLRSELFETPTPEVEISVED
jgi:hypothetical protein